MLNYVFSQSPKYTDKVWELLKEILPEFKLTDDPTSESKIAVVDAKSKELGKEGKDGKESKEGKEVKDVKEFKPEPSMTTLKILEKSDKTLKGKHFRSKCFSIRTLYLNDFQSFFKCNICLLVIIINEGL